MYSREDGVGPRELRPRRPELAWLTEESNQFGTGNNVYHSLNETLGPDAKNIR